MSLLSRITNAVRGNERPANPAEAVGATKLFTIVSQPMTRRTVDISDFIAALSKAESRTDPLRYMLYNLYDQSIDYNTQLANAIDLRREEVINKKYIFQDAEGNEIEDVTVWLQSPDFKKFVKDLVDTRFYGFSLFDFSAGSGKEWFSYELVNRKHVDPIREKVYRQQIGGQGVSYTDQAYKRYVMPVGNRYDLGILKNVIPDCIYVRNLKSDWANYAELAGNNFMIFKSKTNDPNLKNQIDKMAKNVGSAGQVQLPDGVVDMDIQNMSSSQQNALFEGMYATLQKDIITRLLGSNMTVQDGSSRSQAEVHENTTGGVHESDLRYILDVLNFDFIDFMPLWGLPNTGRFTVASETLLDPLAVQIGAAGVQSMQSIIVDPNLTPEQKKNILTILFGISEADADKMTAA